MSDTTDVRRAFQAAAAHGALLAKYRGDENWRCDVLVFMADVDFRPRLIRLNEMSYQWIPGVGLPEGLYPRGCFPN